MNQPLVALVVPSIREASFGRFVDEWLAVKAADGSTIFDRCALILVEDNPAQTFKIPDKLRGRNALSHMSWVDIDDCLGENAWVIPRRSDTVRSFGYYEAWRRGFDYIWTLDDDCYPNPDYPAPDLTHLEALTGRSRWFNTLTNVKPRGVPFKNTGTATDYVLSHGLWTNVLDYDAPTQLVAPDEETFPHDNRTVPAGMYYPMCGMNVMWRADVTYAMYHLIMGCVAANYVGSSFPKDLGDSTQYGTATADGLIRTAFDRFGDIWAGVLSKRFFDEVHLRVCSGVPYIHHDRASDPFVNLRKEAAGLQVNERFWQFVDDWGRPGSGFPSIETKGCMPTNLELYEELVTGAFALVARSYPEHEAYCRLTRAAVRVWCSLFSSKSSDSNPMTERRVF